MSNTLEMEEYGILEEIILTLLDMEESIFFREPVNYVALGLTDYPKIVKKPMDLSTVYENLKDGIYKAPRECLDDIQLVWDNCKLYNVEFSKIYKIACNLEEELRILVENSFGKSFEYGKNNPSYEILQERVYKVKSKEFFNKVDSRRKS